jgi:hypothetical protein
MTALSGGLKYNWLDLQKHLKFEKVTGSQDDGFVGDLKYNWLDMQQTRKDRKSDRLSTS